MNSSVAQVNEVLPHASKPVVHYAKGSFSTACLPVICESELHVVVDGRPVATLMCSDAALRELTYGFLFDEEVVDEADEVASYTYDPASRTACVSVVHPVEAPACPVRSSGFAGTALRAATGLRCTIGGGRRMVAEPPSLIAVIDAVRRMQDSATEYASTRGMHCSALFADGAMLAHFEDIGRHNTLDKLAGFCMLEGVDPHGCLLTTTGRVSGEMMRKAYRLGVACVASLSGPTNVAVDLAREVKVALVGYVRESTATAYAGYAGSGRTPMAGGRKYPGREGLRLV